VVVGANELDDDVEEELEVVAAERSPATDCDPTPEPVSEPVTKTVSGGERTVRPVVPGANTAASTGAISAEVDTEVSMELLTAKVKAPAATTPAIEMVVAREVFIGITI
jgi:hypothetical protein